MCIKSLGKNEIRPKYQPGWHLKPMKVRSTKAFKYILYEVVVDCCSCSDERGYFLFFQNKMS